MQEHCAIAQCTLHSDGCLDHAHLVAASPSAIGAEMLPTSSHYTYADDPLYYYRSYRTMSNTLTSIVPVLSGSNAAEWFIKMESYLQAIDSWTAIEKARPGTVLKEAIPERPATANKPSVPAVAAVIEPGGDDEKKAWDKSNQTALGSIRLRISTDALIRWKSKATAKELWDALKKEYDTPGIARVYLEFKNAMDVQIPANSHPRSAMDKLDGHFEVLTANGVNVPGYLQAMILLAKIPSVYDTVAQYYIQNQDHDIHSLDFDEIRRSVVIAYEQRSIRGKVNRDNADAHKLSAIKRRRQDQTFNQQQRQNGSSGGEGNGNGNGNSNRNKVKRGKRGGRKFKDQHQHAHITEIIGGMTIVDDKASVSSSDDVKTGTPPTSDQLEAYFAETTRIIEGMEDGVAVSPKANTLSLAERISPPIDDVKMGSTDDNLDWDEEPEAKFDREIEQLCDWYTQAHSDPYGNRSVPLTHHATSLTDVHCSEVPSFDALNVKVDKDVIDLSQYKMCTHSAVPCSKCNNDPSLRIKVWILDSGASIHFTNNLSDFVTYKPVKEHMPVATANGHTRVAGKGTVLIEGIDIKTKRPYRHFIEDVHYIPSLLVRLLSMGQFLQNGLKAIGDSQAISLHSGSALFMRFYPRRERDSIYILIASGDTSKASAASIDYDIMHRRFGHPSKDALVKAKKHTLRFPSIEFPEEEKLCPGCAKGKMPQKPFPAVQYRASAPFELIHSDLKSFPIVSYHKYEYIIVFFDDFTSYAWISLLRKKSAAIVATRQFIQLVKNQHKTVINKWMSDAGGEYKSHAFDDLLKEEGIQILQSAPYTPQQNGRAERFMRTVMDKAEAMRHEACLPDSWWEFAVEQAQHVYVRTPMRRLNWRTPFEALYHTKPTIDHLRVFGCGAYVHIAAKIRANKLAPKSELMTYIGVPSGERGFRFMRSNNTVFVAAHAIFDEHSFPRCPDFKKRARLPEKASTKKSPTDQPSNPSNEDSGDDGDDFAPQEDEHPRRAESPQPSEREPSERDQREPHDDEVQPEPAPQQDPPQRRREVSRPPLPHSFARQRAEQQHQQVRERERRERRPPTRPGNIYGEKQHPVDQFKDAEKMRTWRKIVGDQGRSQTQDKGKQPERNDIPDHSSAEPPAPSGSSDSHPGPVEQEEEEEELLADLCQEGGVKLLNYLFSFAIPPTTTLSNVREWTFRDILRLPAAEQKEWKRACLEELEALKRRKVYELVDRPKGRKVIKNRWVFDVKSDGRKKARLVAKGFSQVEGLDFDQIFSPVVRFETVRLVFALAALNDWHITAVDVRNAYLYGDLEEEIYMEQPEGFIAKGTERKVCRLRKALYGLKQAGLAWWHALNKSMSEIGFVRLNSDAG